MGPQGYLGSRASERQMNQAGSSTRVLFTSWAPELRTLPLFTPAYFVVPPVDGVGTTYLWTRR